MDPYSNGYTGRGSVPNRNNQYQSPGFGKHHGPQYAQQQAQHYQKGPANPDQYAANGGRKHAYSVDVHHKPRHPPNPHYMKQQQQHQQQQPYPDPHNPYDPNAQRRKHRKHKSPSQHTDHSHQQNPRRQRNDAPDSRRRRRSKEPEPDSPNSPDPSNPRTRRRSKSPYDDDPHQSSRHGKRSHKQSVPNVAHSSNNQYMNAPQNHRSHHSSTPNASHHNPNKQRHGQQRRQRGRSRQEDANKEYRKRTGSRQEDANGHHDDHHRHRSKSRQHPDGHMRPADAHKRRKGSRSPNPNAPYNDQDQGGKRRRHTTAPRQENRQSKSPNPDRHRHRKRKKSRSPNPNNPEDKWDKLQKGKLTEKFLIREKLGQGNFSVVRRVIRKSDGLVFAAKIISTSKMLQQDINDTHEEVEILGRLDHPNIVHLVDYIFTPRHLYIVLECLSGGELFDRLQKKKRFTERMAANITKQIGSGLAYLHEKGIVHRDLKPENLIYEHDGDDANIKISDFGLSRDTRKRALKTSCGTPGYVAPEIIRQQPYDETVDLWALGVIIYILLCGYPPFVGAGVDSQQVMFKKIKSGKYDFPARDWAGVSSAAMDCIDCLLVLNPKDRMSAKELLEHPWIAQLSKKGAMDEDDSFANIHFKANLSNYLHKQRFRRGVRLIITLNRMVRGAGLGDIAVQQRAEFRKRLKQYKKQVKAEQKHIYNKQQQAKLVRNFDDEYLGYTIIDPDATPAIDYSKV
eukprot:34572_1